MNETIPNYTNEVVEELVKTYEACDTDETRKEAVQDLALKFNKSEASVRAKLSTLGVYKKPERVSKDGKPIAKKEDLVEEIASNLNRPSDTLPGLEKANKATLKVLAAATAELPERE